MNNLTSSDIFFIRRKIQQSLKPSQSPKKKSKKLLKTSKTIRNSSTVSIPKQTIKSSKKIATQDDLNDWMIKKQLQVKRFLTMKKIQEQEFNDKVKSSQEIKFRSKQDWLKLRLINYENLQINKTQSSEALPEKQKQKQKSSFDNTDSSINETLYSTGIQKYYTVRDFSNKPKSSYSFQALKRNTLRSTSYKNSLDDPQKYEQAQRKSHQRHNEYILKPRKQVSQSLVTPKFNYFLNIEVKKQPAQRQAPDNKPPSASVRLIKAYDFKFKNPSTSRFPFPSKYHQSMRPLNSYSYRQMQPQEQTQLKTRFLELDNRLEQLLRSVRKQQVSG